MPLSLCLKHLLNPSDILATPGIAALQGGWGYNLIDMVLLAYHAGNPEFDMDRAKTKNKQTKKQMCGNSTSQEEEVG